HSDIVLPATLQIERNDFACSPRDRALIASHKLTEAAGDARDDYWIFERVDLGAHLGHGGAVLTLAWHR
ncbi:MAG TPA: molybdopterin-dependent oxidoreductase, partial [Dongiaceae bacterium]|nr:molybdopterin-dependent oxidoreductase [Dongiaceae bacterium]